MEKRKWYILIGLLTILGFFLMPNLNASACGTFPVGAKYCLPFNMISSNGNVMPSNSVVNVLLDAGSIPQAYWNSNIPLSNAGVYNTVSGNSVIYPAWIENSNSITSNTINIQIRVFDSSWTTDNNLAFVLYANTINKFSTNGNFGEAPNLSSSYGLYDNGNVVFPFYDNFAGTTLKSIWTVSGTFPVNNGISSTSSGAYIITTGTTNLQSNTLQVYGFTTSTAGSTGVDEIFSSNPNVNPQAGIQAVIAVYAIHSHNVADQYATLSGGSTSTPFISSFWQDNSNFYGQLSYGTVTATAQQYVAYTNSFFGFSQSNVGTLQIYWARWEPTIVNPSITFGTLTSTQAVTLTITPNPNYVGLTASAVAFCISNHCDIDSPLGTHLCASIGTNQCNYQIPPKPAGSYNFYANDLDQGIIANVLYRILAYNSINCNFKTSNILLVNNVTYQNNIATGNTLIVYSTTNGLMNGWQNITARFKFKAFTVGQSGTTNYTQTLYVQPNYVFRLNYTGTSSFEEQCVPIPNFIAGNGILFTTNTNSTTIAVFNGIGLGFNSTGALINLNASGSSSGSTSPSNDNALNGVIPALIGCVFIYGYIHDLNDEEKRKDEDAKLKWFKNRYLWLAFAFSLFLSAFFVSQLTTTATSSGSTTTFNYIDNIGLTFVGQAFGFMIIAVVVVLGIARLSNVVLKLRF